MKRKIITTSDGSPSIRIDAWDEQYHSKHGAITESQHVFLQNGLYQLDIQEISILEMGFGTGLNALLTFRDAKLRDLQIRYTAVEAYPVNPAEWGGLNYPEVLKQPDLMGPFQAMHVGAWEETLQISDHFELTKRKIDMASFKETNAFNLIYFDAFGYRVQPELWSQAIFLNMFQSLTTNGILVTYASKGVVRRNMVEAGFQVEKLPGPPGKREMIRAKKV